MNASVDLTQAVVESALQAGAVLVGVAPIDRFDPTPPYYDRAPKGADRPEGAWFLFRQLFTAEPPT